MLLEKKSCTVFKNPESGSINDEFMSQCCQDEEVLSAFSDITSECEVDDQCKELVLKSILHLYFKIRVHHVCRQKMDKYRSSNKVSVKGLRKGLKTGTL